MSEPKLDPNGQGVFALLSRAAAGEEITVRDDRCALGALSDVTALDRQAAPGCSIRSPVA